MGIFQSKRKTEGGELAASLKIVLIGLENAGKTSLLNSLTSEARGNECCETVPTIGFNIGEARLRDRKGMVFDVGGGSKSMWRHYTSEADLVIFLVDAADPGRFDALGEELLRLARLIDRRSLLVFLLNKIDLDDSLSIQTFVARFKIDQLFQNDLFVHRLSIKRREGFAPFLDKMTHALGQPEIHL